MTLDEIKADIIAACEGFKAAGYEIVTGGFMHGRWDTEKFNVTGGCALMAVAYRDIGDKAFAKSFSVPKYVEDKYGWSGAWPFVHGFDGARGSSYPFSESAALRRLGFEVRGAVLP